MKTRAVLVLLSSTAAAGCGRTSAASRPAGPPAVPVVVATAAVRDVPDRIEAVATVEPLETVKVSAQASGAITAVRFAEGRDVRAGDLLFELDPRPYQSALAQAEGNLARDQAQEKKAAADASRAEALFAEGILSKEDHDQARATLDSERAAVATDAAAVQSARLELGYTRVRSPIAGRTGAVLVQPGNVVKAADATPLVVINRVDPIYVSFAVPDPRLAQIQRAQRVRPLPVEAVIAGDEAAPPTGRVSFVDNQVDAQTGTIRLKATFPNPSGRLWPGRFVRARLTLGTQVGAVVIPAAAVQAGQQGSTVFVMKPDQTVEQRGVVAHPAGEGQVVVDRGVAAGESVVVDGQLGLTNGAKVQPRAASGAGQ